MAPAPVCRASGDGAGKSPIPQGFLARPRHGRPGRVDAPRRLDIRRIFQRDGTKQGSREERMMRRATVCFFAGIALLALLVAAVGEAGAQEKKLKIGVIFDYTGPLAGGGSELHALGAKMMID
jgi:hypothetical protein